MRRTLISALPALALFLLIGCGPGGSTVSGQMNFGTTKLADGDKLSLTLFDGKMSYSSEVDESGNFKFQNVPDGSYTLTITHYKTATASDPKAGKSSGSGAPETKTYPENFKVPGGPYTIEMAKITPAKK